MHDRAAWIPGVRSPLWVKSVASCNGRLRLDLLYTLLATKRAALQYVAMAMCGRSLLSGILSHIFAQSR